MTTTFNVGGTVNVVAILEPGLVKADGDLSIAILRFNYELDGVRAEYVGAIDQALTDDSWNWIFLDYDGSLNINTTGFPTTTHIRLAKVLASSGFISAIVDERVLLSAGIDKEIHQDKAEGQDSTTSTDWSDPAKIRLTLTDIPEGTYVVQWYCELRHSNNTASERAEMRVEVNDTTEIGFSVWPYNVFEDSGGMTIQDIAAGNHTVDLDFRVQGSGTAYIRRARLMMWRIA